MTSDDRFDWPQTDEEAGAFEDAMRDFDPNLTEAESEFLDKALSWVDKRFACPVCGPQIRDEQRENRERLELRDGRFVLRGH